MADPILAAADLSSKLTSGTEFDFFRQALLSVLRELMEIEVESKTGACKSERSPERLSRRNGYRQLRLDTRVASLMLPIPKLREGTYFPSFLEPRRRSDEALLVVIADAYAKDVSTRKVEDIVLALGLEGISKSKVSHICSHLDEQVQAFRGRPLVGRYPYLFLDATYEKVRDETGRVVSMALVVAYAVAESGKREPVDLEVCRNEDHAFWRGLLASLVSRGFDGVALVFSDAHQSLKRAIGELFLGAGWQHCRVHFLRNLLALAPKDGQDMVLAAVEPVLQQLDQARGKEELRALADHLSERLPRVSALLPETEEEILCHMDFPREHCNKISATNPLERLNKEIDRKTQVVGIFPNEKSLIRLIGTVLAEQNDEWAVSRRWMSQHSLARTCQRSAVEIEGEITHPVAIPMH